MLERNESILKSRDIEMDTALGYTTFLPYGREITGGREVSEQSKAERAAPAAAETATAIFRGVPIPNEISTDRLAQICFETLEAGGEPFSIRDVKRLVRSGVKVRLDEGDKKHVARCLAASSAPHP